MTARYTAEWQLSDPVQKWLREQGYKVYVEVSNCSSIVDMIGFRKGHVIAVELKLCLTKQVIYQASCARDCCHASYAAVATKPRKKGVRYCEKLGMGILVVQDGEVTVQQEAKPQKPYRLISVEHYEEGGVAGHPTLKGEGPAISCFEEVKDYLDKHPKAIWREIYEAVPNHYCSAQSMCGALSWKRWNWEVERDRLGVDEHGNIMVGPR